ncbi:hypothetical protein FRC08_001289 [Ceratobasidium sp. 394]|nr:hypothetical protein FRC08_001289 [Ceratobasidium sp. 394]KAG9085179.1 hypothetical protein FS749_004634 [Ceratobasidium sp. UAMH 11750]
MSVVVKSTPSDIDAAACPVPAKNPLNPQGLKPCCACPETKSARDDCFLRYGPDEAPGKCADLLQKHIACMRSYGFNI